MNPTTFCQGFALENFKKTFTKTRNPKRNLTEIITKFREDLKELSTILLTSTRNGNSVIPMKVLFVCLGNAFRSPVAEALLKKLKPEIQVDSAGINPSIPISEAAKKYLARENAEQFLKQTPEGLDEKDLDKYDLIIAMEQRQKDAILSRCPKCENKIVVWDIADPYFLPHGYTEKIFRQIKEKVLELANSL
jgi:protein-tyrosine phosphatase